MLFVELVADRLQALLLQLFQIHFDRQTQALTVITQIDLVRRGHLGLLDAFGFNALRCIAREFLENLSISLVEVSEN